MPHDVEGLGALTGFLIFLAIRVDNSCAKLTIFDYHIFYLFVQILLLFPE